MNKFNKLQQGFTLIEVVILLFLFSVLLLGIMNIYDWQRKVYLLEQAEVASTGSARQVLNSMTSYIPQASNVETSRTISGTTYTTNSSTLVLQIPTLNSSGNVVAGTYDYLVYYTSGNRLLQLFELGAGSVRPSGVKELTSKLDSVSFTYDNANLSLVQKVSINLQTRDYYRGSNSVVTNLQNTIFLRNK